MSEFKKRPESLDEAIDEVHEQVNLVEQVLEEKFVLENPMYQKGLVNLLGFLRQIEEDLRGGGQPVTEDGQARVTADEMKINLTLLGKILEDETALNKDSANVGEYKDGLEKLKGQLEIVLGGKAAVN